MARWEEVASPAPQLAGAGRAVDTDPATVPSVAGSVEEKAPPGPYHLFRADVTELVVTRLGEPADHLVIESWRQGREVQRVERR